MGICDSSKHAPSLSIMYPKVYSLDTSAVSSQSIAQNITVYYLQKYDWLLLARYLIKFKFCGRSTTVSGTNPTDDALGGSLRVLQLAGEGEQERSNGAVSPRAYLVDYVLE